MNFKNFIFNLLGWYFLFTTILYPKKNKFDVANATKGDVLKVKGVVVNIIYNGYYVRAGKNGEPEFVTREPGFPKTAADWPVTPKAFYYGIKFLCERYPLPLYITENGMSCHDNISYDGCVHDYDRINFLDSYIGAMEQAIDEGADVRGYFLWTFLDNFEWSDGYKQRFGIVYVDFQNQRRVVKDSAFWYKKVI